VNNYVRRWFETITSSAKKKILAGLFCLFALAILTTTLLFQGIKTEAQHSGETIFLPLLSRQLLTILPEAKRDEIQWRVDEAPFPIVSGQAVAVSFAAKEYLFLIGGGEQIDQQTKRVAQTNRVFRVALKHNGELGVWSGPGALPNLPRKLHGFSATAVDNRIYVLGGLNYPAGNNPLPNFNNQVYCAQVNEVGTFANWEEKSQKWQISPSAYQYELSMAYHSAVYLGGRLYVLGGLRRGLFFSQDWDATRYVFSAAVGDSCEDLVWEQETLLPFALRGLTAVGVTHNQNGVSEQFIYLFGGLTNDKNEPTAVSYRARVGANGLETWKQQALVPDSAGMHSATAVQSGNYLYFIAGTQQYNPYEGLARSTVYRTKISSSGDLQPWQQLNELLHLYGHATAVSKLGRLYVVGGAHTIAQGKAPVVQNRIYWTPLLFFGKVSEPPDIVLPGQEIRYRLTLTSNNVRDLIGLVISDTLPSNVNQLYAPNFTRAGQFLVSQPITLPINHTTWQTFTAVVTEPTTPTPNGRPAPPDPEPTLQSTPSPETAVQPIQPNVRPTQTRGCMVADAQIDSGTPRPKPTCTPTPQVTVSTTSTNTATVTPTVTITPTKTIMPTPIPEPVVVVNEAMVCLEATCITHSTAVTAPFKVYLPLVTK
jgi:hypothetical protein